MSWELGNVTMCDDVREAVAKLKLYSVDVHQIVESTPGPLSAIDLPTINIPKSGFMKCFLDIALDVPSFPRTEIQNLMQTQKCKDLPKPFGLATASPWMHRFVWTWLSCMYVCV